MNVDETNVFLVFHDFVSRNSQFLGFMKFVSLKINAWHGYVSVNIISSFKYLKKITIYPIKLLFCPLNNDQCVVDSIS